MFRSGNKKVPTDWGHHPRCGLSGKVMVGPILLQQAGGSPSASSGQARSRQKAVSALQFSVCFSGLIMLAMVGVDSGHAEITESMKDGGHILMTRHALAPGTDDPANFRIGDCSTQRNLGDRGRKQAKAISDLFFQIRNRQLRLCSMLFYARPDHGSTAFFIPLSAATWAGLIASNFLSGYLRFRCI